MVSELAGFFGATTIVFIFAKFITLLRAGITIDRGIILLPRALAGDVLLAVILTVLALYSLRLARALMLAMAALYAVNFFYVPYSRALVDQSALELLPKVSHFRGAIIASVDLLGIALAAVLIVQALVLTSKSSRAKIGLHLRGQKTFTAITAIWLGFAAALPSPSAAEGAVAGSPLFSLLAQNRITHNLANQITPLDQTSPFPQPTYPELPKMTGKAAGMNFILFIGESLSKRSLQRSGFDPMPAVSSLAKTGLTLERCYSTTVLTIKSQFAIHTGFYPSADFSWITRTRPRFPAPLLPKFFKDSGYRTAFVSSEYQHFTEDFNFLSHRGYDVLVDGKILAKGQKAPTEITEWTVDDRLATARANQWIKQGVGPFFLTVFLGGTHYPYNLPTDIEPKFPGDSPIDRYHSTAYFLDRQIEEIVEELKSSGRLDSTVIFFVGDHGEDFGQHQGNFAHSTGIYEESVTVPCLISNPRLFPTSISTPRPTSLVDLFPTALDLAGINNPGPRDGHSVFSPPQGRLLFFSTHQSRDALGLADGDFKFIETTFRSGAVETELYNLAQDPDEKNNLAPTMLARTEAYRQKITDWRKHAAEVEQLTPSQINNGIVRLTDLPIAFTAQDWGELRLNQSVDGNPFRIAGKSFETFGFGTHANSIISFDVSEYKGYTLQLMVGRDEEASATRSSAHAEIWVNGAPVVSSPELTNETPAYPIKLVISGSRLSLVINRTKTHVDHGNHFDWIEPVLIRP